MGTMREVYDHGWSLPLKQIAWSFGNLQLLLSLLLQTYAAQTSISILSAANAK